MKRIKLLTAMIGRAGALRRGGCLARSPRIRRQAVPRRNAPW